jgi:hypothetical protein
MDPSGPRRTPGIARPSTAGPIASRDSRDRDAEPIEVRTALDCRRAVRRRVSGRPAAGEDAETGDPVEAHRTQSHAASGSKSGSARPCGVRPQLEGGPPGTRTPNLRISHTHTLEQVNASGIGWPSRTWVVHFTECSSSAPAAEGRLEVPEDCSVCANVAPTRVEEDRGDRSRHDRAAEQRARDRAGRRVPRRGCPVLPWGLQRRGRRGRWRDRAVQRDLVGVQERIETARSFLEDFVSVP